MIEDWNENSNKHYLDPQKLFSTFVIVLCLLNCNLPSICKETRGLCSNDEDTIKEERKSDTKTFSFSHSFNKSLGEVVEIDNKGLL